jgi:hypothetical protein
MGNINSNQNEDISTEEFEETFKFLGRKLGFFISSLSAPEEIKNSWLSILPQMSIEQMERLANIFEEKYAQQETQYIDNEFKKILAEIEIEKDEKLNKIDEETLKKLNDLAKKIAD